MPHLISHVRVITTTLFLWSPIEFKGVISTDTLLVCICPCPVLPQPLTIYLSWNHTIRFWRFQHPLPQSKNTTHSVVPSHVRLITYLPPSLCKHYWLLILLPPPSQHFVMNFSRVLVYQLTLQRCRHIHPRSVNKSDNWYGTRPALSRVP
jgi:hypothetical protein